ncbi:hypothetical protein [Streptomyces sp. TRM64462]|uniref:hypothetical protein n=1 Tax=Streptomyces sp. TRM64462 TaxID=2741726 RepID=UPI001585F404|nr:hypothetical protein [Streptomyces sp. TRM64462]
MVRSGMRARPRGNTVVALAVLCAVAGIGAAAPVPGSVRIESAAAGPTGRTAAVTYTYLCEPEQEAASFAVRLSAPATGAVSGVTHVREPQVCDGRRHTRTDMVAADPAAPDFRPGDSVVARVLMTVAGSGVAAAELTSSNATASASRAMVLD